MRDVAPPRAAKERVTPDSRKDAAVQDEPRATSEAHRQRERVDRPDLPGKPANRMYRDKDKENGERRRSKQKSDN